MINRHRALLLRSPHNMPRVQAISKTVSKFHYIGRWWLASGGANMNTTADEPRPRRRDLLPAARAAALSLGGMCALVGCAMTPVARADDDPEADVTAMNTAISVEHLGIAAYQHAAESGLLTSRIRALALVFQGHHRQHRDAFVTAVQRIGGTAVQAR